MKKIVITFLILFFISATFTASAQNIGIKTNFAHWAFGGTPNAGLEFALGQKHTMEIGVGYNPFTFGDSKKLQHWIVQPEFRYWTCERFNGHFFGVHALIAEYNMGGIDLPVGRLKKLKDYRYEGFAYGAGLSYGYQWPIAKSLDIELSIGAGYAYLTYDKFKCVKCGEKISSEKDNYLGITKAAVSLIYFIK